MKIKRVIIAFVRLLGESVLPLVFWIGIIFGFDTPDVAVLTILTALIHEIGHLLPSIIVKGKSKNVRPHLSGFRIQKSTGGYSFELIELISGPGINLLIYLLLIPFGDMMNGYISLVGSVNLVTALSNLIPIEGYDGYGIIKKIIEAREAYYLQRPLYYLSFALSTLLTFLALYLLMKYGEGYWIFGVFFSILLTKISKLTKEDILRE